MGDVVSIDTARAVAPSTAAPQAGESASSDSPATYVNRRIGDALRNAHEITDWVYATQCVHTEYADAVEDNLELVKDIKSKCDDILKEHRSRNRRFF